MAQNGGWKPRFQTASKSPPSPARQGDTAVMTKLDSLPKRLNNRAFPTKTVFEREKSMKTTSLAALLAAACALAACGGSDNAAPAASGAASAAPAAAGSACEQYEKAYADMIAGLSGEAKDAQQKIFEVAKEAMKALPEDQREAACRESLKGMQGTADSAEDAKEAASEAAEDAKEAAEDAKEAASDAKEAAQEAAEEAKEKAK